MKRSAVLVPLLFTACLGLLTACGGSGNAQPQAAPAQETEKAAEETQAQEAEAAPAAEGTANVAGIVTSMAANSENSYRVDYLEQDPYLTTVYAGFGFAKDYTSAIGHTYTLEDVANTARPHPLANCLTCKTPDYTRLVNELGEEAYSMDFEEVYADMKNTVSCYNCHGADDGNGGELTVTHSYVTKALGDSGDTIAPQVQACGQCHIEYYFAPETKATSMPYDSVAAMSPEAILAYYDEMGFADWTQEATGVAMLKAQHPEFETFMGEGSKHKALLTCADCHMEDVVDENGNYTSHKFESPLQNENILGTCAKCHGDTDMTEYVHGIQEAVTAKEKEVGESLAAFNDALAAKVAEGASDEDLAEVRQIYRSAQWYWDFCYVENSEGAHNSALANDCLDRAAELISQGMELL